MTLSAEASTPGVLGHLRGVCEARGLPALARELGALDAFLTEDLARVEAALRAQPTAEDAVGWSARHLLELGGKRLRPLCVALASRLGAGFGPAALDLAVAVELVHSATLLHDDVVDLGAVRRGRPAARVVYGNAASIFAGDALLVAALRRVAASGVEGLLPRLFDVIDEMIEAEAAQLARRGAADADERAYFRIIEGKTASLFRFAMFAGARAGGLSREEAEALERYGRSLGLAFQIVDDTLDVAGDRARIGKDLLADLREGKATYPIIVACGRDPTLPAALAELAATPIDEALPAALVEEVLRRVDASGAIEASRSLARTLSERAQLALEALPAHPAQKTLAALAAAAVDRSW